MNRDAARQQIKDRIDCRSYLEKTKGGYYCPYCESGHGQHGTGAVKYYPETNDCYCHKCGKHFDVIDLYQQKTGTDYNTALQELAQQLNITIDAYRSPEDFSREEWRDGLAKLQKHTDTPQKAPEGTQKAETATNDKSIMQSQESAQNGTQTQNQADYTEYYKKCEERLADPAALSYLQARSISYETAASCHIGYDPQADPAGNPGGTAASYHPARRIIIPTTKSHYVGRAIDQDVPKEYQKMNVKGSTPGLFNGKALEQQEPVFVVEGAFDALSVIEAGGQAVALNGARNIEILLKQIKDGREDPVIICLDNDQAGQDAARKIMDALKLKHVSFLQANISGSEKDANELLQKDREAFKRNIQIAIAKAKGDYLTAFYLEIQTQKYRPYKTGLQFFDNLLSGGIIRQTLLILLAAPGAGKTTLCQQIMETIAEKGKDCLYLNLEMSREQMIAKSISGRVTLQGETMSMTDVTQGYRWTEGQREAVAAAFEEYRQKVAPHMHYTSTKTNIEDILKFLTAVGDKAKAEGREAPAVAIDYLHLIKSRKPGADVQEVIKAAVAGLKQYAIDYDTFVILISATNRTSNGSGRIVLESGRDSSGIEFSGDCLLSLQYYEVDNGNVKPDNVDEMKRLQEEDPRRMILRVLKSRWSQPGKTANVYFDSKGNHFYGEDEFISIGKKAVPFDGMDINNMTLPEVPAEPRRKRGKRL